MHTRQKHLYDDLTSASENSVGISSQEERKYYDMHSHTLSRQASGVKSTRYNRIWLDRRENFQNGYLEDWYHPDHKLIPRYTHAAQPSSGESITSSTHDDLSSALYPPPQKASRSASQASAPSVQTINSAWEASKESKESKSSIQANKSSAQASKSSAQANKSSAQASKESKSSAQANKSSAQASKESKSSSQISRANKPSEQISAKDSGQALGQALEKSLPQLSKASVQVSGKAVGSASSSGSSVRFKPVSIILSTQGNTLLTKDTMYDIRFSTGMMDGLGLSINKTGNQITFDNAGSYRFEIIGEATPFSDVDVKLVFHNDIFGEDIKSFSETIVPKENNKLQLRGLATVLPIHKGEVITVRLVPTPDESIALMDNTRLIIHKVA